MECAWIFHGRYPKKASPIWLGDDTGDDLILQLQSLPRKSDKFRLSWYPDLNKSRLDILNIGFAIVWSGDG